MLIIALMASVVVLTGVVLGLVFLPRGGTPAGAAAVPQSSSTQPDAGARDDAVPTPAPGTENPAPRREPQVEQASTDRPDNRIPMSGTYTGWGHQRSLAGADLDKTYALEMTFSGAGSTVRYPDLGCAGRLRPTGFDGQGRVYVEEISEGRCDDGGTWVVEVEDAHALDATYSPPSGRYVVVAELDR